MLKVGQMKTDIDIFLIAAPTVEKLKRYEFNLPDDGLMVWHEPKHTIIIMVCRRIHKQGGLKMLWAIILFILLLKILCPHFSLGEMVCRIVERILTLAATLLIIYVILQYIF